MPELEPLRADHGPAVLAFELANRAYFAASVSDRGDEFFDHFTEHFARVLVEQASATSAFYVLVDEDGAVLGRFNLYDVRNGVATVGYRLARHTTGRGVATATLRKLCVVASGLGLHTLVAATSDQNVASRKVLIKVGFGRTAPRTLPKSAARAAAGSDSTWPATDRPQHASGPNPPHRSCGR